MHRSKITFNKLEEKLKPTEIKTKKGASSDPSLTKRVFRATPLERKWCFERPLSSEKGVSSDPSRARRVLRETPLERNWRFERLISSESCASSGPSRAKRALRATPLERKWCCERSLSSETGASSDPSRAKRVLRPTRVGPEVDFRAKILSPFSCKRCFPIANVQQDAAGFGRMRQDLPDPALRPMAS